MLISLLVFLVILSVIVLIHEAGHFFVAKYFGIKVEEFGFGFPPKAFSIKRGETVYSINWLPIGGFVKLYGEDEAGGGRITAKSQTATGKDKDAHRAFYTRSVWQRAAVCIAGVVMNALLAVVIFYVFLSISGFKTELPLFGDHKFFGVNQQNVTAVVVSAVSKDSPAYKAGLKPFIKINTVNGKPVNNTDFFVKEIQANRGKEVTITWEDVKTNKKYAGKLTPRQNPPKGEGSLGVGFFPATTSILSYDTTEQKLLSGIIHPLNLLVYNFEVMGSLFNASVKQKTVEPLSQGVSGPVGVYSLVGNIVQIPDMKERVLQILNLSGILSISLALFNILPIPALDGGRLFFIMIEAVTGRKVNQRFEALAHSIGMMLLLAFLLMITLKDYFQFFK